MPHYLYEGSYSAEAFAALAANPRNISDLLRPSIEAFGGNVVACYIMVPAYEPIGFVEFPDNVMASAWVAFMSKQRGIKSVRVTPLITPEEALAAVKKAASADTPSPSPW